MKIEATPTHGFLLKEVYAGVMLETEEGECFAICMRDIGFEYRYGATIEELNAAPWRVAKKGEHTLTQCAEENGEKMMTYTLECDQCGIDPLALGTGGKKHKAGDFCPLTYHPNLSCDGKLVETREME
jgi:hypothetical protein